MSETTSSPLVIQTPVHGATHEAFAGYWRGSIHRVMPEARVEVYQYADHREGPYTAPGLRGDLAKMERTHEYRNLLTTDIDALFVAPFTYKPSSPAIILAMMTKWMLPDTDPELEPDEWGARMLWRVHEKMGLKNIEPLTIQPWAIWSNGDLMPHFKKEVNDILAVLAEEKHGRRMPFTIPLFSVMWHRLKQQGKAEAMPGGFMFHLPVYSLERRLEMVHTLWTRMQNVDTSR